MSDFGSFINVRKTDGSDFSQQEQEAVLSVMNELKESGNHKDFLGESLQFALASDEADLMCFIMTEYAYGDGDDEENYEFAEEEDSTPIENVKEAMKSKLSSEFNITSEFTHH